MLHLKEGNMCRNVCWRSLHLAPLDDFAKDPSAIIKLLIHFQRTGKVEEIVIIFSANKVT